MVSRNSLAFRIVLAALCVLPRSGFGTDAFDDRREQLQKMSAVEKDELRRNQERLKRLDPKQQQLLRELDHQLTVHPEGDRLRQVMLTYHEWLRTLPSAERAELLSLSEEKRIPKIKEMLSEQETARLREIARASLSPEDVLQVQHWFRDLAERKRSELLAQLPPHLQDELARSNDPRRLTFELLNHRRESGKGPPMLTDILVITEEDRQRLVEKLSAAAQDVYRRLNTEQDKRTVFQNWGMAATFSRRMPSPDELRELLQRLPPETRDRVENLPPEQMKAELSRMFFNDRMRRWGPDGKRPPFPGERFKERTGGEPPKRPPYKGDADRRPE